MHHTNSEELARYEQIALMIAGEILRGTYSEGERVSGRTILAGQYGVSPETVRKALALLQARQVVEVVPGSGVIILSRQAARDFIEDFHEHNSLEVLERRLDTLIKQRNKLNAEIDKLVKEIVHFKTGMLKNMQNAEEVLVSPDSPLVGKSVQEAQLRTVTGVTVTAVRRRGRWYASPGTELRLNAGDLLLVVGNQKAVDRLRQLAEGKQALTDG
ncbi:Transcription regulator HTH, GntR [Moorella glycerini]|uniref:DNA-binding transcriptional repressor MngR n=1 Tax=Neomoorella stamsii TaxID=1266720 RepID=A0A9X7P5J0_9FIRM|nr:MULTISPECIES: TrkA C-terminal domain-containing protein [Moorella]PRR71611.1 DNA-binding transcriptional repressor MngR [Moorella stamsii]CEP66168.1 Transcription regulator HTH, GntR [Moorella glycerini]